MGIALGILGIVLAIGIIAALLINEQKWIKIDFYNKVQERIGNPDFSRPKVRERVKEIARECKVSSLSIEKAYYSGKKLSEDMNNKEDRKTSLKEREQCIEQEYKLNQHNTQYLNCNPIEKRINMLDDEIDKLLIQQKNSQNALLAAATLNNAMHEKENDSALLGGIAAGVAGKAYGASVYLENEIENQEIRRRNQQRDEKFIQSMNGTFTNMLKGNADIAAKINEIEKIIDLSSEKLYDVNATDLMSKISFKTRSKNISRSGACRISVNASCQEALQIGQRPAVIDGFIKANLIKDGRVIDTTILALPVFGLGKGTMNGVFPNCKINDKSEVTVRYEEKKLWLIEV